MRFTRNKILSLALYITTIITILLSFVLLRNSLSNAKVEINVWPVLFLFIALLAPSVLYIIYLNDTNEKLKENEIATKVEKERNKILAELNKREEFVEDTKIDLDEIVSRIVPKSNFKSVEAFATKLLQNMGNEIEISQGVIYIWDSNQSIYKFLSGYALTNEKTIDGFKPGENLNGQVVITKELMVIDSIPEDYLNIESGLGKGKPINIIIAPILFENETIAVLEFATFKSNSGLIKEIFEKLASQIASKIVQIQKS